MAKYNEELENQIIELFGKHTFVTTDLLRNFSLTTSTITARLMNKGLVSRCRDPLCYHRYLYFLSTRNIEQSLKEREQQALINKREELKNKIARLKRAKEYHIEFIRRYDEELVELSKELGPTTPNSL